jgi:hypothetical protein
MSNRGLAAGVFRAWGIMWAVYAFVRIPQFVNLLIRNPYSGQKEMAPYVLSSDAISLGCQVAVAIVLISRASWLASIVFPEEHEANMSFDATQLRSLLFSAIGLYFLLEGGRHVVGGAVLLLTQPRTGNQNAFTYLWQREPQNFAMGLAGAIAGAVLFFGQGRPGNPWSGLRRLYQRLFALRESSGE